MPTPPDFPRFRNLVIDCLAPRALAGFYSELLGLPYLLRDGQTEPDDDWAVLRDPDTGLRLAFQEVPELAESTWPEPAVPPQLHLDFSVPSMAELDRAHERAVGLGARLLFDQTEDDAEEQIRIYADPAGHPFCLFVLPADA